MHVPYSWSMAGARAAALIALFASPGLAVAGDDECLGCHSGGGDRLELSSGEAVPLSIDAAAYRRSVHGQALSCVDCHADEGEYPHRRASLLQRRRDIVRAATARCGDCHDAAAATYARSVHGERLRTGDGDAPACSDCHGAHTIAPASGQALASPETCGRCHGDAERMKRHGLSPGVVSTYLQDFHGMAATLQRKLGIVAGARRAATCVDCHGAHDVARRGDPASRVSAANRVQTCGRCHPDSNPNFPAAFLGHAPPTWRSAALVIGVQLFYRAMIPFMVAGLLLQIALHVWRMVVRR
jgi:hypothetical protein